MNRITTFLRPVPRRDWVLLPLLSLATLIGLFVAGELISRAVLPESDSNACVKMGADFYRVRPNCTARTKVAEGQWATYHFNECGYRGRTSCGPAPPGALRIAVIGSSVGQAYRVTEEDTFYARAAQTLSHSCGRPVDVQNLSVLSASPLDALRQAREAQKLRPDVVVFMVVPFDVEKPIDRAALDRRNQPGSTAVPVLIPERKTLWRKVEFALVSSRAVLAAEHLLFQDRDTYIRLFLRYGDKADFMRPPFSPAWQQRFDDLQLIVGDIASSLRAAQVPLLVMPVPSRAEAALLSARPRPPHVDPLAFGREVDRIAASQGAAVDDVVDEMARLPHAEQLYLAVDGHVAAEGQKLIADSLVAKLLGGELGAFRGCSATRTLQAGVG